MRRPLSPYPAAPEEQLAEFLHEVVSDTAQRWASFSRVIPLRSGGARRVRRVCSIARWLLGKAIPIAEYDKSCITSKTSLFLVQVFAAEWRVAGEMYFDITLFELDLSLQSFEGRPSFALGRQGSLV